MYPTCLPLTEAQSAQCPQSLWWDDTVWLCILACVIQACTVCVTPMLLCEVNRQRKPKVVGPFILASCFSQFAAPADARAFLYEILWLTKRWEDGVGKM